MELEKALKIAVKNVNLLSPYCSRIEIAGSCRRKKSIVKDIELVVIVHPQFYQEFADEIYEMGSIVKGKPTGRYMQILLTDRENQINLDLFIATKDNWGLIYAIRTGSKEYSHKVLAIGWCKLGYRSKGGILYKDEKPTYIREEQVLFELLGIDFVPPENRNLE